MVLLLQMGSFIGFGIAAVQFHLHVAWMVFRHRLPTCRCVAQPFLPPVARLQAGGRELAALASAGATSEQAEAVGVSILKPLRGIPERLEANLETFFRLRYPVFEILSLRGERGRPRCGHCKEHDASVS